MFPPFTNQNKFIGGSVHLYKQLRFIYILFPLKTIQYLRVFFSWNIIFKNIYKSLDSSLKTLFKKLKFSTGSAPRRTIVIPTLAWLSAMILVSVQTLAISFLSKIITSRHFSYKMALPLSCTIKTFSCNILSLYILKWTSWKDQLPQAKASCYPSRISSMLCLVWPTYQEAIVWATSLKLKVKTVVPNSSHSHNCNPRGFLQIEVRAA